MKKLLNPIVLLVAFNILFFLFGDLVVPEDVREQWTARATMFIAEFGALGYLGFVAFYVVCAFFFIPLLIPLNIASGVLFGPYVGTAVSLAGITLGSLASAISVRHVFTGMQGVLEKRPAARDLLTQIARHGAVVVIMVRLAFFVPYQIQNIVIALAPIKSLRLMLLTAPSALPGAAIYCFLGAGLMQRGDANALGLYLAVSLLLLAAVSLMLRFLNARYRVR